MVVCAIDLSSSLLLSFPSRIRERSRRGGDVNYILLVFSVTLKRILVKIINMFLFFKITVNFQGEVICKCVRPTSLINEGGSVWFTLRKKASDSEKQTVLVPEFIKRAKKN